MMKTITIMIKTIINDTFRHFVTCEEEATSRTPVNTYIRECVCVCIRDRHTHIHMQGSLIYIHNTAGVCVCLCVCVCVCVCVKVCVSVRTRRPPQHRPRGTAPPGPGSAASVTSPVCVCVCVSMCVCVCVCVFKCITDDQEARSAATSTWTLLLMVSMGWHMRRDITPAHAPASIGTAMGLPGGSLPIPAPILMFSSGVAKCSLCVPSTHVCSFNTQARKQSS